MLGASTVVPNVCTETAEDKTEGRAEERREELRISQDPIILSFVARLCTAV
jgi:hypothetical protein